MKSYKIFGKNVVNIVKNTFSSLHFKNYAVNSIFSYIIHNSMCNNAVFHMIYNTRMFSMTSSPFKNKMINQRNRKEINRHSETYSNMEELEDDIFTSLVAKHSGTLFGISSVAVIQPWVKWGPNKRYETNPGLLLDEACSLVNSIPNIVVSYKEHVSVHHISKTQLFGAGTLERLVQNIKESSSQAVFISVEHLTRTQKNEYEKEFGRPVFDRYFIVLSIFKHYANTFEARLQIAIADLHFLNKKFLNNKEKLIIHQREAKLKQALKRISGRKEKVRKQRRDRSISSIAVIGYTNCGKTSLVGALTRREGLEGENRLFATLDVTAHKGCLPCGLNVLFLDSVGFIQNIPTTLVASFHATLEDTIYSDVIMFVRDISHPDNVSQTNAVNQTLKSLSIPEETPIIIVNNKVDLLEKKQDESGRGIYASAVTGEGLNEVLMAVQREVLKVTGRKVYKIKLPTGSLEVEWLKKMMAVTAEEVAEEDPQCTNLYVVMNEAEKAAFKKAFKPT